MKNIKYIGFDADDTLWVNEPYYKRTEQFFCELLEEYLPENKISEELFKTEMQNLNLYGFGTKSFMLSMVETAIRISGGKISPETITKILDTGKAMLSQPIEVLDGVESVLKELSEKYKLIVATKGDLLDQERKLESSGLEKYFHHIEIMSDKKEDNYQKLLNHLEIPAQEFVMIGNSLKSDILPVININGYAIHIPFHTTWEHEKMAQKELSEVKYFVVESIKEIPGLIYNGA